MLTSSYICHDIFLENKRLLQVEGYLPPLLYKCYTETVACRIQTSDKQKFCEVVSAKSKEYQISTGKTVVDGILKLIESMCISSLSDSAYNTAKLPDIKCNLDQIKKLYIEYYDQEMKNNLKNFNCQKSGYYINTSTYVPTCQFGNVEKFCNMFTHFWILYAYVDYNYTPMVSEAYGIYFRCSNQYSKESQNALKIPNKVCTEAEEETNFWNVFFKKYNNNKEIKISTIKTKNYAYDPKGLITLPNPADELKKALEQANNPTQSNTSTAKSEVIKEEEDNNNSTKITSFYGVLLILIIVVFA